MISLILLLTAADVCPAAAVVHKKPIPSVKPIRRAMKPVPPDTTAMLVSNEPETPAEPASQPLMEAPAAPIFRRAEAPAAAPIPSNTNRLATGLILFALMGIVTLATVQVKKRAKKIASAASQIEVLASHSFSPKQRMQVVQIGGERMLVAVTDKGIQLLCGLKADAPLRPETFEHALNAHLQPAAIAPERASFETDIPSEPSPEIAGILRMKRARDLARIAPHDREEPSGESRGISPRDLSVQSLS